MKGKNAAKETKKAASENVNKKVSDYQSGKKSVSQLDLSSSNKKK